MPWAQETGLLDLVTGMPVRPRPQSVLFAPPAPPDDQAPVPLPPLPGYHNPGAGLMPDFTPIGQSTAMPSAPPVRSTLSDLLQGSQGTRLPTIFNAGVQSSPDIAIPTAAGVAQPPGYRRTISADGGPTFFQPVRPEERGVNGQDLLRQGTTVAEIQAAHPGWSATQQLNLFRQGQQDAAHVARQNFVVGNESANRNAGIMPNADFHAQDQNTIARQRLELEAYERSPEGIRARAEAAGLASLFNNPATAPKDPADLVRILQGAGQGGMFRGGFAGFSGGTNTGAARPSAPNAANPSAAGSSPVNNTGYDPSAVDSGGPGPIYAPHQRELDRVAATLPTGEATPGAFLARMNRDNPAFLQTNFPAVQAYMEDKFGRNAVLDAGAGVRHSPTFGYTTPNTPHMGVLEGIGRMFGRASSAIGHATGFGGQGATMTPDQEGRAMLADRLRRLAGQ